MCTVFLWLLYGVRNKRRSGHPAALPVCRQVGIDSLQNTYAHVVVIANLYTNIRRDSNFNLNNKLEYLFEAPS